MSARFGIELFLPLRRARDHLWGQFRERTCTGLLVRSDIYKLWLSYPLEIPRMLVVGRMKTNTYLPMAEGRLANYQINVDKSL